MIDAKNKELGDKLIEWIDNDKAMIHFTQQSELAEKVLEVTVVFCCICGICIVWGPSERFIPWHHIKYIDIQTKYNNR